MNKISKILQTDWPKHLSYDLDNKGVDTFYDTVHGALREDGSLFRNKRQIDIFLMAMAIGKELGCREKVKRPSNTIRSDALTEDEVWMMCSVVLSDDDAGLEVLADPKQWIKVCEEYANCGIKTLMELDRQIDTDNRQYEEFLTKAINQIQKDD